MQLQLKVLSEGLPALRLKLSLPTPVVSPAGDLEERRFGNSNPDLLSCGLWELSPEIPSFQEHLRSLQVRGGFGDHQSAPLGQPSSLPSVVES